MQSTLFGPETDAPPVVIVWENVPGVLSDKTNAFGCFLAGLAGEDVELQPAGKRWTNAGCVFGPQRAIAWRTLDAQYFGLAQRRRRVFVVASARDGFDPAQVLLEWDGMRRDSAPSRSARKNLAPTLSARTKGGGGLGTDFDLDGGLIPQASMCLTAGGQQRLDAETETLIPTIGGGFDVAHSLRAEGFDASEDGTGRGTPLVPVAFDTTQITSKANYSNPQAGDPCHPLAAGAHAPAVAQTLTSSWHNSNGASAGNNGGVINPVIQSAGVRRLTPRECERLQGFPDDWTNVPYRNKPAADGPRYKSLGNSMAVPCMFWIGRRINDAIKEST